MGSKLFCFLLLLSPIGAKAEYRAYRLEIVDLNGQVLREVISTMDHLQYPAYHSVNPGEYVRYGGSWMCWGRTDQFTKICTPPTDQTADKLRFPPSSP